jgi:RNA polymerase sigma-70 factor, ECF subfamily
VPIDTIHAVSDAGLMRRVAEGDLNAFEAIHDRYRPQALAQAMRLTCQQPGAAEEVTQEAFLSLWSSAARYEPSRASLKTWLLLLVRSRGIDSIRRRARHDRTCNIDGVAAEQLTATESIEEEFADRDEWRHMRQLLRVIPSKQREVIELAYFNELTHVEIATSLNLPLGTVKGRLRLALAKLQVLLVNEGAGSLPNQSKR